MRSLKKIDAPQNLTALAYGSIKSYILRADLDEETRLTEEFLSNQLGISKSPVREALNSLHTQGLIRIEARRGAYLRRFTAKEVKDLYDLRETLEVYAVGAAIVTPELLYELSESTKRTSTFLKVHDRIGHIEEDTKFHGLIAVATGNAELCRVLANIQNQVWLCRRKTYDLSASTSLSAHRAILEALQRGSIHDAQGAMRSHISLVRKRLVDFMEQKERSNGLAMVDDELFADSTAKRH
jgi:DNA-binding GntR family transcriptional regulator